MAPIPNRALDWLRLVSLGAAVVDVGPLSELRGEREEDEADRDGRGAGAGDWDGKDRVVSLLRGSCRSPGSGGSERLKALGRAVGSWSTADGAAGVPRIRAGAQGHHGTVGSSHKKISQHQRGRAPVNMN